MVRKARASDSDVDTGEVDSGLPASVTADQYVYTFTGEYGSEDFPTLLLGRTLQPGEEIALDYAVEHPRLKLVSAPVAATTTPTPSVATPDPSASTPSATEVPAPVQDSPAPAEEVK